MKPLEEYDADCTDEVLRKNATSEQTLAEDYAILADHSIDLEHRLAACREALEGLLYDNIDRRWGINGGDTNAMICARETLALTAPKP